MASGHWITNGSGQIVNGGQSQQVFGINPSRKYLYIENPSDATEPLYVDIGIPAAPGTSWKLDPGGTFQLPIGATNWVPEQPVNVFAVTPGHPFIAKEGG